MQRLMCASMLLACGNGGGTTTDGGATDTGVDTGADVAVDSGDAAADGACSATINVTVQDPTGKYPLPNVAVFVESSTLPTITPGLGGACPALPTGVSRTAANGAATVMTSASGSVNIVAQIGKWRTVSAVSVAACGSASATIKLAGSKSTSSDVPALAVSTGGGDTMECALHRMGIDGAVTVYQGANGAKGGTSTSSPTTLWNTSGALGAFDAVLLSCEGAETTGMNQQPLVDYTTAGGRVLAEHFQYSWFNTGPFAAQNIATWLTGNNAISIGSNAVIEITTLGMALTQWLTPLGVLVSGEIPLTTMKPGGNISAVGSGTTLVIATDTSATPPNAPMQVTWVEGTTGGSVVYTDYHAATASGDYGTSTSYPAGCATEGTLNTAEIVFLYTVFEQLSCAN